MGEGKLSLSRASACIKTTEPSVNMPKTKAESIVNLLFLIY